jgi:hypothetical protein
MHSPVVDSLLQPPASSALLRGSTTFNSYVSPIKVERVRMLSDSCYGTMADVP